MRLGASGETETEEWCLPCTEFFVRLGASGEIETEEYDVVRFTFFLV